jgi:aerobic-type carbon monoxide dehydrogenase small subunit (CoxS/CutS family)
MSTPTLQTTIVNVSFSLNGKPVTATVPDDLALVDYLQEQQGLSGTRLCCGIGVCKVCTVKAQRSSSSQGEPMLACSTPVALLQGQSITTIEGVGTPQNLSPVQQTFLDSFAFQCGYCTPGFVMATTMLMERLQANPIPESELKQAIFDAVGEHICRCTGYTNYYGAIDGLIRSQKGLLL